MSNSIEHSPQSKHNHVQDGSSVQVNIADNSSIVTTGSPKSDSPVPKKVNEQLAVHTAAQKPSEQNTVKAPKLKHVIDCDTAKYEVLKGLYPSEFNSWRASKSRAKKSGLPFAPDFGSFAGFLKHHGPKPHPSYSLDRIINEKGYVVGNTRWASKAQQAENRRNVRRYIIGGTEITLPALARALNITNDAFRKDMKRGLSAEHAIVKHVQHGLLRLQHPKSVSAWPWPEGNGAQWEQRYLKNRARDESRCAFFLRRCREQLNDIYQSCRDPYSPTDKERKDAEYWNAMQKFAQAQLTKAIKEELARKKPPCPDAEFLRQVFAGDYGDTTDEQLREAD